jgi:thiosulfate/3-mercaptopyruvate sulfurtransferase
MNADHPVSPLIEVDALRARLDDPTLLLVDCRYELGNAPWGRSAYDAGHIPGALFASMDEDLSGPRRADAGRHPLPSSAAFAATLGRWGFSSASHVVAYDQNNGARAARLWWMLRARGHDAIQVLNGGLAAWQAASQPMTQAVTPRAPTPVEPREFAGLLASADVVVALAAQNITLVDARDAERFAGRNETIDPVPGRVPGALNHPFTNNLSSTQHFLPAAELRQRWSHVLDRPQLAPVVAMCGSGITGCHNLLALELAGHTGARLYAGSYSEWITDPSRPVATGQAPT